MKIIAFIMAVMVLVLGCLPCQDNEAAWVHGETMHLAVNDDHDKAPHEDLCSPLCSCACCSTASVHNPPALLATSPGEAVVYYADAYLGAVINISLPVWQPPQLAA